MMRNFSFLLMSLLLSTGCTSKPAPAATDTLDYPHRVIRIDAQRLLAGDMRYNIKIHDGDVLIPSNDELFTNQDEPDGPLTPDTLSARRSLPPPYKIKPGDLLSVTIYELHTPGVDDQQLCRVDGHGWIRIPIAGPFDAAGSNTTEIEQTIATRLEAAIILRDPTVSVQVIESKWSYTVQFSNVPDLRTYRMMNRREHRILETFSHEDMQGIEGYRYIYVVRKH